VGVEVAANESGNREVKRKREERVKRMCVRRDVVIK
jgi:hypothetical protein